MPTPPEIRPHPTPLPDTLDMCIDKAAFLADAVTGLAECNGRYDLSVRGLRGLALYLLDLEQTLAATTLTQEEV